MNYKTFCDYEFCIRYTLDILKCISFSFIFLLCFVENHSVNMVSRLRSCIRIFASPRYSVREFSSVSPILCSKMSEKQFNEVDRDEKYDILPKYKKINQWDKDTSSLKIIGRIMSSKRDRSGSDSLVLEGVRMIRDALDHGLTPSLVVFSREKLLWQLGLDQNTSCKLYHIPYNNIKMWTDLSTSPGRW